MRTPKLIIFDMDGLLFDSERLFMHTKGIVMQRYGYQQTEADYLQTLGTTGDTLHAILRRLYGPDYPADTISRETRAALQEHVRRYGIDIKPGIPALLAACHARHIPCCVATSSQRPYALQYIESAGLTDDFDFLVCGDEITHSKPDPEIFLKACKKAETNPRDALVLEDSENGILAAAAGDIPVVCIPDLKQPDPEIAKKAAAVVSSAFDVIPLLFESESDNIESIPHRSVQ